MWLFEPDFLLEWPAQDAVLAAGVGFCGRIVQVIVQTAAFWASGDSFYYKLELNATPDLTQTPAVEDIRLDYTPAAGYEKTFIFDKDELLTEVIRDLKALQKNCVIKNRYGRSKK